MSYADTIANDYKVAAHDDAESVTLTTKPAGTTTALTFVVSEEISVEEVTAGGGYLRKDGMQFEFGANQIVTATVPKPGDTITRADTVVWEILSASLITMETVWRVTCVKDR